MQIVYGLGSWIFRIGSISTQYLKKLKYGSLTNAVTETNNWKI
jgi:hypothetical protein